jgi:hypothetical protein
MEPFQVNENWVKSPTSIFWAEIAPCDHVVQIYETDEVFLDLLFGFIKGGIEVGESVIIIATASHLEALKYRLTCAGWDYTAVVESNLYIPLDADITLSKFMVNDWPDETLFMHLVSDLITKAKIGGRPVRAFGEMVAILWAKGQVGATVRLEQLWNKFCETQAFCLFCAYPKNGFTQDAVESVMHICGTHSKLITVGEEGAENILYRTITQKQVC